MERTCGCCDGTGKVQLDQGYIDVLQVLDALRRPVDIARYLGISETAAANRLVRMAAWGLTKKEGRGKWRKL